MKNLFLFLTCLQLSGQSKALFKNDQIIELTLYGQIKDVFKDRGESSNYHRASVIYNLGGANQEIPLKIKTRGNFRRSASNCKLPPLLLNFRKNNHPKNSLFYGQNKLKLVTSCKGENLVIQEYLVYRLYNLLTPYSFKAQLVNVTYKDADKDEIINQSYGILLENEKDMAVRNEALILSKLHVNPQSIQRKKFLKMAVFEYLIGNTDWSIQYQQNIKLIQTSPSNLPISIPYDFDHAGIVRAPYAKPSHALKMTSTRERRYRGFCVSNMNELADIFEEFNRLRDSINKK